MHSVFFFHLEIIAAIEQILKKKLRLNWFLQMNHSASRAVSWSDDHWLLRTLFCSWNGFFVLPACARRIIQFTGCMRDMLATAWRRPKIDSRWARVCVCVCGRSICANIETFTNRSMGDKCKEAMENAMHNLWLVMNKYECMEYDCECNRDKMCN